MGEARPKPDVEVLQEQGARGGNRLLLIEVEGVKRLLKCYRGRRGSLREPFRHFGHYLEGKRGTSPHARYATERASLKLWAEHGFDVPEVIDAMLPVDVAPPALWLEYCPGPTLRDALRDEVLSDAMTRDLLRLYGRSLGARQALALQKREPLLIHEHASVFHVLVYEGRLVTFDLEGGYRPGVSLEAALEQELGGFTRSILRARPEGVEPYVQALVEGYVGGDPARHAQALAIATRGVEGGGLVRRVRRVRARYRRRLKNKPSKADGCRLILDALARHKSASTFTPPGSDPAPSDT